MLLISYAYFMAADRSAGVVDRVVWSAHGIAGAIIYLSAMAVGISGIAQASFVHIFLSLQLIPVALILFSLLRFRGARLIHVLQIPNVLCLLWGVFIGSMAVIGDWL